MNATANGTLLVWKNLPTAAQLAAWYSVSLTLSAVGVAPFLLVITVLLTNKALRRSCGILVAYSLTLEFCVCCVMMPLLNTATFQLQIDGSSPIRCRPLYFVYYTLMTTANWTLTLLALTRLCAAAMPSAYHAMVKARPQLAGLAFCWICGLSVSLPPFFGYGNSFVLNQDLRDCTPQAGTEWRWSLGTTIIGTFLPYATTGLVYLSLLLHMVLKDQPTTTTISRAARRRMILTKMFAASALWYLACFVTLPVVYFHMPQILTSAPFTRQWLRCLFIVGFTGNPVIYLVMNREYRMAVRQLFCNAAERIRPTSNNPHVATPVDGGGEAHTP